MSTKNNRFTVEIVKMTASNGVKKTVAAIPFEQDKPRYRPEGIMINSVLPEITKHYEQIIMDLQKDDLTASVSSFLDLTSQKAIVGLGLANSIARDLNKDIKQCFDMLLETVYVKKLFDEIRSEYRKGKKNDPVRYAESCQQIVDLFGFNNALKLFKKRNVDMKKSNLQYLYNVSIMQPKIKEMISSGELRLTVAFMIPQVNEDKQLEIANALKNINYTEAKKRVRHIVS